MHRTSPEHDRKLQNHLQKTRGQTLMEIVRHLRLELRTSTLGVSRATIAPEQL